MTTAEDAFRRKADRIFQQALDLEGEERERRVHDLCDGDRNLLAEVQSLLIASRDTGFVNPGDALRGPVWRQLDEKERAAPPIGPRAPSSRRQFGRWEAAESRVHRTSANDRIEAT